MRIYISGKIGEKVISEATRRKFNIIQEALTLEGHDVFNPTDTKWVESLKRQFPIDHASRPNGDKISFYTYALLRDLMVLATCDAIYMLPDFLDSPGAKAEHAFAIASGLQVYYDDELYRDGTLRGNSYQKNRFPWRERKDGKNV